MGFKGLCRIRQSNRVAASGIYPALYDSSEALEHATGTIENL
jgi:hypothetical protein